MTTSHDKRAVAIRSLRGAAARAVLTSFENTARDYEKRPHVNSSNFKLMMKRRKRKTKK